MYPKFTITIPNTLKYIDGMNLVEFEKIFEGLKPLFKELTTFNNKCENVDNIVFLSFFKIVIDQDLKNVKNNIDKLYLDKMSYAKIFLDCYFFNYYGRSILLDLFRKTLQDLFIICKSYCKRLHIKGAKNNSYSNFNNLKIFKSLLSFIEGTERNTTSDKDMLTVELIKEMVSLMRSMSYDLQNNFEIIPTYVSFCTSYIMK